ncbi:hypothetical protein C0Q70_03501 [Pomacea canaliculata]|uniref:Uncharacterized protein n=1 Tax=Pomacea canaliculata TaxID=400727 RepID=A0A2T7PSW7_POMCA|nr:hypothetical protein C0Q70_03501 [Pomacea canaliculata]
MLALICNLGADDNPLVYGDGYTESKYRLAGASWGSRVRPWPRRHHRSNWSGRHNFGSASTCSRHHIIPFERNLPDTASSWSAGPFRSKHVKKTQAMMSFFVTGLTTQQLAGMMTNSGSYYNMTMGNITGSGYPSSYPSSYPSGSGPPLDNTIGTGSGFPGGMGSGFPGGMGSGSPGSYPSVGTTPPPQLPGGMTGNTGAYNTGGSGVIPPPPMGLPGSSNTGMATALALMQQRRLQQQRKQQQQQQQMTNLTGGSMNNILGGGGMMPGANSMLGGRSLASAGSMGLPNMFSGPGVGGATQQLSGTPMDLLSGGSNPMSGLFSSGSGTTGGGGGTGGIDLSWSMLVRPSYGSVNTLSYICENLPCFVSVNVTYGTVMDTEVYSES